MSSNLIDNNNFIITGLRADVMRCSMETKNLLDTKGSIYVGTGRSKSIQVSSGETVSVPITAKLEPNNIYTVLTSHESYDNGLGYSKVTPDMIDPNSGVFHITAQNAVNATNASEAGTATVGLYASSDQSKGTIEERIIELSNRLNNLGHHDMPRTQINLAWSGDSSLYPEICGIIVFSNSSSNSNYREGNLTHMYATFNFASNPQALLNFFNGEANIQTNYLRSVNYTVPTNFRPKSEYYELTISSPFIYWYNSMENTPSPIPLIVRIYEDGQIRIGFKRRPSLATYVSSGSQDVTFGYETTPYEE